MTGDFVGKYLAELSSNLIVSCGHTIVKGTYENLSFGVGDAVSPSQLKTVIDGANLAKSLRKSKKKVKISVSLSDSYLFEGKNEGRRAIKNAAADGSSFSVIPPEYVSVFREAGFNDSDVSIFLQTDANRVFERVVNKLRSTVNRLSQELDSKNFLDWSFTNHRAVFLSDPQKKLFSMTHPFLFNSDKETKFFEGDYWKGAEVNSAWLKHVPLLRLKKNPVINLYQSGGKLLCPGTYAGFLKMLNGNCDVIEFLSRKDDEFIGEKVYRGVITAHALDGFKQKCLTVIYSEHNEPEITLFSDELLTKGKITTAHELCNAFMEAHTGEMILL